MHPVCTVLYVLSYTVGVSVIVSFVLHKDISGKNRPESVFESV